MKSNSKKRLNRYLTGEIVEIVCSISCILMILCFLFVSIQTRQNVEDSMRIAASYSSQLMEQIIHEAENIKALIQSDSEIQAMLRNKHTELTDIYTQRLNINGYLSMLKKNYAQSAEAFYIVLSDGRVFKSTNFPLRQEVPLEQGWYKSLISKETPQWLKPYQQSLVANNRKQNYIAASYPLYNLRNGFAEGIILVEFRLHTLESIIQNGLILEQSGAAIVDSSDVCILDISRNSSLGTMIEERVELTNGWSIVFSCAIMSLIFRKLWFLFVSVVVLLAISILVAGSVARKAAHKVSDPIGELLKQMEAYDNISGHIEASIPSDIYEMDCLIENYNRLLNRITELFGELEKREKDVKRSEFAALQAQINPHFLYNTLDTINCLALQENVPEISELVAALAAFYRISLSRGQDTIPICDEVRHAQMYLRIQGSRFENQICERWDISPAIEDCLIIKIVLQPIIENALIHGIFERDDSCGHIFVRGWRDDQDIYITVTDDGVGMPPDVIAENFENNTDEISHTKGGYGIRNINDRLKIAYGPEYGLSCESTLGVGTVVTIHIPAQHTTPPQEGEPITRGSIAQGSS